MILFRRRSDEKFVDQVISCDKSTPHSRMSSPNLISAMTRRPLQTSANHVRVKSSHLSNSPEDQRPEMSQFIAEDFFLRHSLEVVCPADEGEMEVTQHIPVGDHDLDRHGGADRGRARRKGGRCLAGGNWISPCRCSSYTLALGYERTTDIGNSSHGQSSCQWTSDFASTTAMSARRQAGDVSGDEPSIRDSAPAVIA